ncbi:TrmH family RNA methyltransferase [Sphingomonas sp. 37zxx]|uniref:TrmH family RNA methyltransferase n=1 Tax=Sphingomonas sp. 37zxx TaxID=1550073 RepID=UPI0009E08215|nr:TrmH family RNA methyltransferase [Sphingomonas sp. 37zxx]
MAFHTYILRCSDGHYYVGHTDNLERRIAQHQAGEMPGYTQTRLPVEFLWSADFPSRAEALQVELQLKGWGRPKKEALIRGDWAAVQALAKKSFDTGLRQAQPHLRTNGEEDHSAPQLAPPPVLILVRPQLGENIGKAARAMLNFGLTELRLVAPRDGWPNPSAGPAASGADRVLAEATVYDSVADAVADCAHVFATTVRRRGVVKPVMTPEQAAVAIHSDSSRAAILFGPERSGLDSDDVAIARTIITVPINPEFGSLNLAQAVMVVAYEWSKHVALAQPSRIEPDPPALQADLDGMIGQWDSMLEEAGYFFPPDRTPVTKRMMRTLLTKPNWSAQEVRTVRGMLTALAKPQKR